MLIETGDQGYFLALHWPFLVPSHNAYGLVDQPREPNDRQGCNFMKADPSSQHREQLANESGNSHSVLSASKNVN